jgi:hypothetical protein
MKKRSCKLILDSVRYASSPTSQCSRDWLQRKLIRETKTDEVEKGGISCTWKTKCEIGEYNNRM